VTWVDNLLGEATGNRSNDDWYLRNSATAAEDTLIDGTSVDTLLGEGDLDWLIGSTYDIMPSLDNINSITERKHNP